MPIYSDFSQGFMGQRRGLALTLLLATIGAALLQWFVDYRTGGLFSGLFGLSRTTLLHGEIWRLATYMFLHGGFWHLLLNMLPLAFFGRDVEERFGTPRFALLYFGSGMLGGLGWVLISGTGSELCIGASGAVFGVIGAFAAAFPDRQIMLLLFFVLPVTMTARMMAIGYGPVSYTHLTLPTIYSV